MNPSGQEKEQKISELIGFETGTYERKTNVLSVELHTLDLLFDSFELNHL